MTQVFGGPPQGLVAPYTQRNVRPQRCVPQSRLSPCAAHLGKSQRDLGGLFWSPAGVNGELEYWAVGV